MESVTFFYIISALLVLAFFGFGMFIIETRPIKKDGLVLAASTGVGLVCHLVLMELGFPDIKNDVLSIDLTILVLAGIWFLIVIPIKKAIKKTQKYKAAAQKKAFKERENAPPNMAVLKINVDLVGDRLKNMDKDTEDYNRLLSIHSEMCREYNELASLIIGTKQISKPMNPYVAGGIANGIAGPAAGLYVGANQINKQIKNEQVKTEFMSDFQRMKAKERRILELYHEA